MPSKNNSKKKKFKWKSVGGTGQSVSQSFSYIRSISELPLVQKEEKETSSKTTHSKIPKQDKKKCVNNLAGDVNRHTSALTIRVLSASHLPKKSLFAHLDPYVFVKLIDDTGKVYASRHTNQSSGTSPNWDHAYVKTMKFLVVPEVTKLLLEVCDGDSVLCCTTVSLTAVPKGVACKQDFDLYKDGKEKPNGKLKVVVGTVITKELDIQSGDELSLPTCLQFAIDASTTPNTMDTSKLMLLRKTHQQATAEMMEGVNKDIEHTECWKFDGLGTVDFIDHQPELFRKVRSLFEVKELLYIKSVCHAPIQSLGESKGKSGAGFYRTFDRKFFLKTVKPHEKKMLFGFLRRYYDYYKQNPHSTLQRFYACVTISSKAFGGDNSFVVLNNVFDTTIPIHVTFDLKGSLQGRQVSEETRIEYAESKKTKTILKDLDIKQSSTRCVLNSKIRGKLTAQLDKDASFLAEEGVMDYSLLIGVHHASVEETEHEVKNSENFGVGMPLKSELDSNDVYFLGIIDILQNYGIRKKMETAFKSVPYKKDEISCVDPVAYYKRFAEFMKSLIVGREEYDSLLKERAEEEKND